MEEKIKQSLGTIRGMPSSVEPKWILLIIILGFVFRILWMIYSRPSPVSDFEGYRRLAEGLLRYHQFGVPKPTAYRLPVYPMFLAFTMLFSESVLWLSFVNVILSTLLIYVGYELVRRLTLDLETSLFASLLIAVNPTFVFFSPVLASEHLFSLLLFFAFVVIYGCETNLNFSDVIRRCIFSGFIFGTAVLTRGEGIFYLPIYAVVNFLRVRLNNKKRAVFPLLVSLLACAVVISSWYIRNYRTIGPGSGLSTTSGLNFYYAHNDEGYGWHSLQETPFEGLSEVEQQKLGYRLGFEYLFSAGSKRIIKDIFSSTLHLYGASSDYTVFWCTRLQPKQTAENNHLSSKHGKWAGKNVSYPSRKLSGINLFSKMTKFYYVLALGALLSIIFLRKYSLSVWVFLYGIVLMNWIGYAVIFWGIARFRYSCEVIFCILTSIVMKNVYKLRAFRLLGFK